MDKYKVSFLPTKKSRKMKSYFLYALSDKGAIKAAEIEINRRFPGGEIISIQGPDHGFIDIPKTPA